MTTTVGVIGCGYWGPNLIRNFVSCLETELLWACDLDENRLKEALRPYPNVRKTTNMNEMLADESVAAIAIATPVASHYHLAKACLDNGKHVLVEKPLATNVQHGEELVKLAKEKDLQLMCDHTFCYTGAVRKIKEVIESGELGKILYFDSVRINLGLFQHDVNVVWDLAPHDLSILDFLIDEKPISVSAHGVSHAQNNLENIAYVTLLYKNSFISHFHVNWLSPIKIRKTIIGGTKRMLVWNDMEPAERIKIYNKGIQMRYKDHEEKRNLLVSYRSGDMHAPQTDHTEALSLMVKEFDASIREGRPSLTDGNAGLRVLKILEAAERSIKADGANVLLDL